jgi:hypothetical protein
MSVIERVFEWPLAKPYRSKELDLNLPLSLDQQGLLEFSPGDVENPKNWSSARRWYITIVAVSMILNATFASSAPSGCIEVSCSPPLP